MRCTIGVLLVVLAASPVYAAGGQAGSGGKVDIEIFMTPNTTVPLPSADRDPYKKSMDDTTGANWKLTYATDF